MPWSKTILSDHSNIKHYGNYKICAQKVVMGTLGKRHEASYKINRPLKDNDGVDLGVFSLPVLMIFICFSFAF